MTKTRPVPEIVDDLAEALADLPGIGPKLANRLAIYLAVRGEGTRARLTKVLGNLATSVRVCERCHNLSDADLCTICADSERDQSVLMVVENVLDLIQIERSSDFRGIYFVLNGLISPINGVGPQDLDLDLLTSRLGEEPIAELIIGLNSSLEAEATTLYISKEVSARFPNLKITRLARGIAAGISLEFVDPTSITGALENRVTLSK